MERKNGFLDLDLYFRMLRENGIDTSSLIKESEAYDDQYWLTVNGEVYYFKETFSLYEELVTSECAKFLGIDAVEYDLAKFKIKPGVISKSFRKSDCKYVSGEKLLTEYVSDEKNRETLIALGCDEVKLSSLRNTRDLSEYIHTLEVIQYALEYHYKKQNKTVNVEKVMSKLKKHFFLDLTVGQFDGFPQNWEIEESSNGISLMPYFDGSATFGILKAISKPRQSLSVNFYDKGTDNYRILEEFLNVSAIEDVNVFLDMFNKLNIHAFTDVLDAVEKRIDSNIPWFIKDRMILEFVRNRKLLQEVVNKCIKTRTL